MKKTKQKTKILGKISTLLIMFGFLFSGIPTYNTPKALALECEAEIDTQIIYSDTNTQAGDNDSVLVATPVNAAWTANIPSASWIWSEDPITDTTVDQTVTFTKTFSIVGTPTDGELVIATDNSYEVVINGEDFAEDNNENNFSLENQDTHTVLAAMLNTGVNTIEFKVTNPGVGSLNNPAGLLYKLTVNENECLPIVPATIATVTIVKYLDDEMATTESADNTAFSMHAIYPGGEGDYDLDADGFNGGDPYSATTSEMPIGSDYSTYENINSIVGTSCETTPYMLTGYSTGNTLAEAITGTQSTTTPAFTNLLNDKFVIVWNDDCANEEPPICDADETVGWNVKYYNYMATDTGMNLPAGQQWETDFGNPLSLNNTFSTESDTWTGWSYGADKYKFSEVENDLVFGANFFPFDNGAGLPFKNETLSSGKDYHFGVHAKGHVNAPVNGDYAFTLSSDDDAWIYVNGVLVADNDGVHPVNTINGTVPLLAGMNEVEIFFAERHIVASQLDFQFTDTALEITTGDECTPEEENIPPVANANVNQSINLPTNSATLNSSLSTDSDGTIVSYIWNFVSGPSTINPDDVQNPNITGLVQGTYVFEVKVTDNDGAMDTDLVTIVVGAILACDANESSQVYYSDTTTMKGANATVPVPTPYHVNWTASIPGATWIWGEHPLVDYAGETNETLTKTFNIVGTPEDSTLVLATDNSYEVILNGEALCADASETNYFAADTCAIESEMLNTGTNTIEFKIKNWAQANGTMATNPAGLLYKLTVNDNECVTPPPVDVCPNDIGVQTNLNQCTPNENLELGMCGTVISTLTYDTGEQTNPLTYDYTLDPMLNLLAGNSVDHHWVHATSVATDRIIWDMGAATNTVYLIPSIDHGPVPQEAQEATLYGSMNPTGPWTIGTESTLYPNGPTNWISDDYTAKWTFTTPYRYVSAVAGSINHDDGDAEIDAICNPVIEVVVNLAPNANANIDQSITLPTNSATLNGNLSTDSDGTIVSYIWNFVSGPSTINPSDTVSPNITSLIAGTYVFELKVTDNDGAIDTDTVSITVSPASTNNLSNNSDNNNRSSSGSSRRNRNNNGVDGTGGEGEVLGAATEICNLNIDTYMRVGYQNNPDQVQTLENFLNWYMNSGLVVDGFYDHTTASAVSAFQVKHADKILTPWGLTGPTGIFYKTTLVEAKNKMCPEVILPIPTNLINWSQNQNEVPSKI